ncbi:MAG: elongation factor P maturation arginine rhamnosyltransferase EarP [Rubrivivax sp.]|nr:elongation factor P maturation arginine rhamnosyltransferase EarP [Rubrivivax sp.]
MPAPMPAPPRAAPAPDRPGSPSAGLTWDLYCRVIDNHGDLGVCWRLARDLATRGQQVRLVVDDASALAWMAPQGQAGVEVQAWPGDDTPPFEPGAVVVEAFGCDPPAAQVERMARCSPAPVWINLEYLSAEAWVERSHALPSPQRHGLTKWFFFPGFTPATGGLLREPGLLDARAAHDAGAWLAAQGLAPRDGERVATLFCYDNPALPALLPALASRPTVLLAAPGPAQRQLATLALPPGLRVVTLSWLTQPDFDRLLWSSALNFVRGEDSLVRAIWAGAPFVWQAYPQHDGVHHAKVKALLDRLQPPAGVAALWQAWNGAPGAVMPALPDTRPGAPWAAAVQALRDRIAAQLDLTTQLLAFVAAKRSRPQGMP